MNDDDDKTLFRQTIGPCQELHDDHVEPWLTRPAARRRHQQALTEMDFALPLRPSDAPRGTSRSLLRRLSRGRITVQDQLDLHGLTVEQASVAFIRFLSYQQDIHTRCLLIIHGKGLRSANQRAILKEHVHDWLNRHPLVSAFCPARPADGGAGAVYVLLKGLSQR